MYIFLNLGDLSVLLWPVGNTLSRKLFYPSLNLTGNVYPRKRIRSFLISLDYAP